MATAAGFRPTELNPRNGAGLSVITRGMPHLPVQLLLDLVVAGRPIGIGAGELEQLILAEADRRRSGGTWQLGAAPGREIGERPLTYRDGTWSSTPDGEPGDAVVIAGGRLVRCTFAVDRTPVGPSVGERAAAVWRFLDAAGVTAVGPLAAPRDVLVG